MSKINVTSKITITISGADHEITKAEAESLITKLKEAIGQKEIAWPIYEAPPRPNYRTEVVNLPLHRLTGFPPGTVL